GRARTVQPGPGTVRGSPGYGRVSPARARQPPAVAVPRPVATDPRSAPPSSGFLRGYPRLQAGEESDSCGAGQGKPIGPQRGSAPPPTTRRRVVACTPSGR